MSDSTPNYPKKLIEVSIPLKEINEASAREKSIRHGHPSTLHLWWARRPLAAARAVLFCQLVDDPSGYVDELIADKARRKRAEEQLAEELKMAPHVSEKVEDILVQRERDRLHDIVKELVVWKNTNNEKVLNKARKEIKKSWARTCRREGKPENTPMPPFLDPFAGGGTIPLEAQRLGLEAHASDLNPVAVLINKAMIEIPPKFADMPPVNPDARKEMGTTGWKGAAGLAEDVRRYGQWMQNEAFRRIGHLYPPYRLTQELIESRPDLRKEGYKCGDELTVIVCLWARTVPSPNPVMARATVPLVTSWLLSSKKGKEAWVEPIIDGKNYSFTVRIGKPYNLETVKAGTKSPGRGANFYCILSGVPIPGDYVKKEGRDGNMGERMFAVIAEGNRGQIFLPPSPEMEKAAADAIPNWAPNLKLSTHPQYMGPPRYGMRNLADVFSSRQKTALSTFGDLIGEARLEVLDAAKESGAEFPIEYANAVSLYLSFGIGRSANYWSRCTPWGGGFIVQTFGRQVLPIVWDYAEANPFSDSTGNWLGAIDWITRVIDFSLPASGNGVVSQENASELSPSDSPVYSTDPPYYDNVPYADISEYFYGWLRIPLREIFPDLLATINVPKDEELVADSSRHGGKDKAEKFFLEGMKKAIGNIAKSSNPSTPITIYYAFRQSEKSAESFVSTGWATFLQAVIDAGLGVVGTWPMRTERPTGLKVAWNALASSIVLVCRPRSASSALATKREFVQALQRELPSALTELQQGNIAPVDLPQSAIGPGMAIFSRFRKVVEDSGEEVDVRMALQLINRAVDEFLSEQESMMDDWTRFTITWFSQYSFDQGPFGEADGIARAKNVAVEGVESAGIIESGRGKVRILRPQELSEKWSPNADQRLTVWEIVHHLIRVLSVGSEEDAALILRKIGGLVHDARALCYRLYTICEQNKWADEARDYNLLMTEWGRLQNRADQMKETQVQQSDMFE